MAFDDCSKLANILPNTLNCNNIGDIGQSDDGALQVRIISETLGELCQFFSIGEIFSSRVCE